MERLLPSDSVWSAAQSDCFLLILDLYHMYLTKICSSSQGEFAWSSSQDHLMVKWGSAEAQQCAMLHVHVVSAMVLLLTFSPPPPSEQRESKYQQLMDFWFPVVKEEKPSANLVDTFEEAELYQDWLKLRMLSSKNPTVVQGVMEVISGEPMEVLMFLMSFGIPLESVEKLLELLDKFAEINDTFPVDPAQIKTVAGYIESHWRRGAASGHKFMEKFGSGGREAIEIDEQSSEITQILPQFVSNDGQREVTSAPMEVEAMLSSITSANGKEIDVEFVQNWSQLLCSVVVGEKDKDCVIDKLKSVEAEGAMKDLPMAALQRFSKTSMETTPSDSHMEVTKEEFDSEVKMAVENGTSNEAVVQNVLEWLMNVRSSGKEKNLSDIGEKLKQLVATNPEFVTYSQDLSVKAVFGENGFPGSDYLLAMLPHSMQMSNFLVVLKHLLDSHSEK